MISKELLIKALGNRWIDATCGRTVEEKFTLTPTGNYILFGYKGYNHWNDSINTYELAHKCKEWALDNGYYLTIYNDGIDVVLQKSCKMVENITDGSFKYNPMLVFKACQWILDNKDK